MTRPARLHYAPRAVAGGAGRMRGLCGARVPAGQLTASISAATCERCREVLSSTHRAGEIAEQLLAASSGDTGEAWRRLAVWIETGVLRGGPEPLRRLLAAVRVELDRRAEPSTCTTEPKSMKPTTIAIFLALFAASACDIPPGPVPGTSTGEAPPSSTGEPTSTSGEASTGGAGYVCDAVGVACDLDAPACAAGLDCVERPDMPGAGVCGQRCNLQTDGVTSLPCSIGWCDIANGAAVGLCRDDDGLPTGLCDGVPSCAGDHCDGACANGLSCIVGACAFACETAKDCAEGQACIAGACFEGDGLADPCN
jgi:hypothetical protein